MEMVSRILVILGLTLVSCAGSHLTVFDPHEHCRLERACSDDMVRAGILEPKVALGDAEVEKCVDHASRVKGLDLELISAHYTDCLRLKDPCAFSLCMLMHAEAKERSTRAVNSRFGRDEGQSQ